MADGDMKVEKTSYGCTITDTSVHEVVAVELEDIPQLINDLRALLPEPEMEIDYNTVVSMAGHGVLSHTYSPHCPEGCRGQMEDCYYAPERTHTHLNDKE